MTNFDLIQCIRNFDKHEFELALSMGADPNTICVESDIHEPILSKLITSAASCNNQKQRVILYEMMKMLLENEKLNINLRDNRLYSPFFTAVTMKDKTSLELLELWIDKINIYLPDSK